MDLISVRELHKNTAAYADHRLVMRDGLVKEIR